MTYDDYKKLRVIEAAEIVSDFLMECSDHHDCGLGYNDYEDLKYMLSAMAKYLKIGDKAD